MRLRIEALGGTKIERVYTTFELLEMAHFTDYHVNLGNLYTGETCHIPVLLWLPPLASATHAMETVRFSLEYVDVDKFDAQACEICARLARPLQVTAMSCE